MRKAAAAALQTDKAIQCREFIHEQLGFVRVSAEIAQLYVELGDDAGLRYQLEHLIAHMRAATSTFKEIEAATSADEGA